MYTTLNRIRAHDPCTDGWGKLLNHLGKTKPDDEPLPLLTILDLSGLDDALWCFRAVEGFEKEKLRLVIGFAREVKHLMPVQSRKALDVFEQYAKGLATQEEFEAARRAAVDAADAADADVIATTAAWATYSAARAARAAAWAVHAADASARAAADAWVAARIAAAARAIAADAAALTVIKAKQETQLRKLLERTK